MKVKTVNAKKVLLAGLCLLLIGLAINRNMSPSDNVLKSKVVRLFKEHKGMCSGEVVHTPSDNDVTLTASHCGVLADQGYVQASTEDGEIYKLKVIDEDPTSDLMILEAPPGIRGVDIAPYVFRGEHARSFTHGNNFDTYITEGLIIQEAEADVPIFEINSDEDMKACISQPKYQAIDIDSFFGPQHLCVMVTRDLVTTVFIAPGSSGGMMVDDKGRLIGVASATGDAFNYFASLKDIKHFLKDR